MNSSGHAKSPANPTAGGEVPRRDNDRMGRKSPPLAPTVTEIGPWLESEWVTTLSLFHNLIMK